ncbi:hypothetical protein BGZ49_001943 [Haplosporangium sp. Z 27]|nr:hypothetical protein BGZ49_001943 [Haplosporangium sp. Z 27]
MIAFLVHHPHIPLPFYTSQIKMLSKNYLITLMVVLIATAVSAAPAGSQAIANTVEPDCIPVGEGTWCCGSYCRGEN